MQSYRPLVTFSKNNQPAGNQIVNHRRITGPRLCFLPGNFMQMDAIYLQVNKKACVNDGFLYLKNLQDFGTLSIKTRSAIIPGFGRIS